MHRTFLLIGGVINLLFAIFHLMFWTLFDWPAALAGIDRIQRSTMQVLNIHLTIALVLFAWVSLFHRTELLTTRLGRVMLGFIAAFFLIRAVNQYLFYDPAAAASHLIFMVCLLTGAVYLVPLLTRR